MIDQNNSELGELERRYPDEPPRNWFGFGLSCITAAILTCTAIQIIIHQVIQ